MNSARIWTEWDTYMVPDEFVWTMDIAWLLTGTLEVEYEEA